MPTLELPRPAAAGALSRLALAAAVAAALNAASALAQVEDIDQLDPMVVTATRTAQTADETLASVTVIDRAQIERRQSRTMSDILRGLPGVSVTSNGGPGQPTSVFLRGTESDHTLVLIDGVKVGSATTGTTPWQDLPTDQIERVEVVRGPRSSLYGSEAIGGVIQIFTRRGGGPPTPRLSVGAGSHDTIRTSGGFSAGSEQAWFNAGLGFEQSAGFDACRGAPGVGGCFVDQPDRDGYTNKNGSLKAGWRPSERLEFAADFLRAETENDFDGSSFAGNSSESVTQVAALKATVNPLDRWTSVLRAGRSWDESRFFFEERFLNRFDTRRDSLGWQNDILFGSAQQLTLGVDYQRDEVTTKPTFAEDSRDNTGVYGQYLGRLGRADLQFSLRQDDNEQFGGQTTWNAALGYDLPAGLRVKASYGTAFKAPTFNELFFPGFGNPDLEPEESRSAELGLSGRHAWGRWAANLYQTEVDELIATTAVGGGLLQPENIDRARIRGLELWATAELVEILLEANLTLLDPRNESDGPDDDNLLPRRPQQSFRLDADRRFGRIGVGASLIAAGRRFDDSANQTRLDGYALVDLRADFAFSDALRLQARVANLFDEDYETAAFFNQPGRTLFVNLLYQP